MNPANAKISVVIPNYNHAGYLPESIESALAQTLKPHEVIVVDDGSTDNTREVALRYPVKYIYSEHIGVSAARNRGISAAEGDWVAFLDADDYWLPNKLELQVAAIHDEALCYCATLQLFDDGHTEPGEFHNAGSVAKVLQHHNCIYTPSVLVKKDVLKKVGGFNEGISAGEDWDVWLKVGRTAKFVSIAEKVVMVRVTSSGLSSNPDIVLASMDDLVAARTANLTTIRRFIEAQRIRSVRTTLAAVKYREFGRYSDALRLAWRAVAYWPSPFYGTAVKVLLVELGRKFRQVLAVK
jgi:glycosyltransferase involved in cell wall biosynthesis